MPQWVRSDKAVNEWVRPLSPSLLPTMEAERDTAHHTIYEQVVAVWGFDPDVK